MTKIVQTLTCMPEKCIRPGIVEKEIVENPRHSMPVPSKNDVTATIKHHKHKMVCAEGNIVQQHVNENHGDIGIVEEETHEIVKASNWNASFNSPGNQYECNYRCHQVRT